MQMLRVRGCFGGLFASIAVALVGCSGSPDTGAGPQTASGGSAGAAGTPVNAGGTAGIPVNAGGAAGTTVNAGGTAGIPVNAGGTAGATVNAGGTAGTTVNAGGAAGTTGSGGATGGSGGATGGTGGATGGSGGTLPPPGDGGVKAGCTLVWSDEFNGPADSPPDPAKWTATNNCAPQNGEAECYTNRTKNAYQDGNGNLVLAAYKETFTIDGKTQQYTSGRLEGKGKFEHTYGRYEARIKFPVAKGLWPAYWLLGNDIDTVSWPQCGEIDMFENRGTEPNTLYAVMHMPLHFGTGRLGTAYTLSENIGLNYHVAAAEWTATEVRFYLDDVLRTTVTKAQAGAGWVYDHPFFLIVNLALGGGFAGAIDSTIVWPQKVLVDYIRVCDFTTP